jgi:predicted DNA-binding transcriptional regulator AlpA
MGTSDRQGEDMSANRNGLTIATDPHLTSVPSIEDLVRNPALADQLPTRVTRDLTFKCLVALNALHYAGTFRGEPPARGAPAEDGERLIGTAELARRIGMGKTWVKSHLAGLPARRNLSGTPRWRLADVDAWIKERPEYGGI